MATSVRTGLLLAVVLCAHVQADTVVDTSAGGTITIFEQLEYAPAQNAPGTAPPALKLAPYDAAVLTEGDYWFSFSLRLPISGDVRRFLQIENPRLEHTEIWHWLDGEWQPLSIEGPGLGMGSHISGAPRVSVLLPPGPSVRQIMVRMQDDNVFVPRMYIRDTEGARSDTFVALFFGGLGLGMIVLLVAFNGVISVFTRDDRYRTLSIYLGASFLFLIHYLGYAQVLLWGDWILLDQRLTHAAALFTFAAYIPFALRMLSLPETWYTRTYTWAMWVAGALEIVVDMGGLVAFLNIIGGAVSIAVYPLALYLALKGNREAWLFVGASLFVLVGGTTTWTEQVWGIGGGTVGHMFFLWGTVMTSLALVVLLARHIVTLRAQRRESEMTARRAQASAYDARQEAQSKGAFLATMSHEIRTPLNGVLGMAELLSKTTLSAEQETQVSTILRSGHGLMAILNDILDYSKFESGQLVLEQEPCDVFVLFDDIALTIRDRLSGKDVEFELSIDPAVPEVIVTDPTRLRQVLDNLLSNAAKFTEAGQIGLHASVADDRLVVKVCDSGIGIREEDAAALFERFRQADSSITRKFGGTGLGLAICKLLCEAMQGSISVTSDYGRGSTFEIRLPCVSATHVLGSAKLEALAVQGSRSQQLRIAALVARWGIAVAPSAAACYDATDGLRLVDLRRLCCDIEQDPREESATPLAGYKLLVAEDNLTNQMVARKTLALFGAKVEIANNGRDALQMSEEEDFDLILMDCDMPVMDGYTASRAIRDREAAQRAARLPIVALTAHAGAEYRERAEACGMDAYLAKPLKQQVLLETILEMLADGDGLVAGATTSHP